MAPAEVDGNFEACEDQVCEDQVCDITCSGDETWARIEAIMEHDGADACHRLDPS